MRGTSPRYLDSMYFNIDKPGLASRSFNGLGLDKAHARGMRRFCVPFNIFCKIAVVAIAVVFGLDFHGVFNLHGVRGATCGLEWVSYHFYPAIRGAMAVKSQRKSQICKDMRLLKHLLEVAIPVFDALADMPRVDEVKVVLQSVRS